MHGGVEPIEIEALAGFDPDPLHAGYDRLIGQVRRLELQKFSGISEILAGGHRVDLGLGRRFHINRWIDFDLEGLEVACPIG